MDVEKLEKLHELKEKGILSAEEFEITKQQILYEVENNRVESVIANSNSYNCNHKSLWEYFNECLIDKYACFKGRASRKEFWGYQCFRMLIGVFLVLFLGLFIDVMGGIFIVSVMFLLPDLAVLIRRFHDAGLSGFFVIFLFLLGIMVKINAIYLGFYADADVITIACRIIMEIPKIVDGYSRGLVISFSDFIWPITSLMFMCNLIFNLIITFQGSEPKENRYGPVPDGVLV